MIALVNGQIIDVIKKEKRKATILIDQGMIKAIGQNISIPEGAETINIEGKTVMPGMIDAHTHVGILEEIYREGDDANEIADPATPHLRAIDAINPFDKGFIDAYTAGVTTVMTGPGSANVIGGQSLVTKTYGKIIEEMVVKNPTGLKVAFGENPKRVYGEQQKKSPFTRMGTAAILRENLLKADHYRKKKSAGEHVDRDLKLEAMALVLDKEIPLRAHAHRADDMITAIRIAEEFDVDIVLEHGTEGHKIVEYLSDKNIPVVVGPSMIGRAKLELEERNFKTAGILATHGVKVAITTDHPVIPINYLTVCAALAVKAGMDQWEALRAITINPAEIIGLEDKLGSLCVGKMADIVVLDGDPLDIRTNVEQVFINGLKTADSTS